jgi:hypothetical protein
VYEDGCILQCHVIPSVDAPPRFRPGRGQGYRRHVVEAAEELQAPGGPDPGRFPAARLPDDEFQLRIEDDAGTRYACSSRAGGGNNTRWDTSYGIVPSVPGVATRLRVLVYAAPVRPASAPLHTFEVSLQT